MFQYETRTSALMKKNFDQGNDADPDMLYLLLLSK
jgi:hypothetical protein